MASEITIVPLQGAHRPTVRALLADAGLPVAGFDDSHVDALVATAGGHIVGSVSLEVYGSDALLRSLVVAPGERGQSLGTRLMLAAIEHARDRSITTVYLLTETAAGFFPRFGFVPVSRADVPATVKRSVEFTSACPASAHVFQLTLTGVSHD